MKAYEFKDMLLETEMIKEISSIDRAALFKGKNIHMLMRHYKYAKNNGIDKFIQRYVYHNINTHMIIELVTKLEDNEN